jgi:hypothetical protein
MGSHYYVAPEILTAQPSSDKGTVSWRLNPTEVTDDTHLSSTRVLLLLYTTIHTCPPATIYDDTHVSSCYNIRQYTRVLHTCPPATTYY